MWCRVFHWIAPLTGGRLYGSDLVETLRNHLIDLGFSPYEADIYLALVQQGPANGSQLARRSGVPRSMAYQALDRLVDKGAPLVAPGSPADYAPVSPAEYFGRLRQVRFPYPGAAECGCRPGRPVGLEPARSGGDPSAGL